MLFVYDAEVTPHDPLHDIRNDKQLNPNEDDLTIKLWQYGMGG